jgi:glycine betaine/proline transport system substrate-binding protein
MKQLLTKCAAVLFIMAFSLTMLAPAAMAEGKKVKIAYVEWACATASTNLVKAAIEEHLKDKVEVIPVSAAAMWQAVASGDVDAMVTAWLPVTHGQYLDKVKDKVEDLGPIMGGAKIGLVVPKYVTIDSIDQLEANADKFKGKIIGIDPGAGIMSKTEQVLKDYDLKDFKLVEGSDATMCAALSDAYKHKEWVAITGWTPHWMFGRFDLKYLKDPKNVFGAEETINCIARKGLQKDMPKVYAFLKNYKLPMADLQKVMAMNQENDKPLENAKKFIADNPDLVKTWFK